MAEENGSARARDSSGRFVSKGKSDAEAEEQGAPDAAQGETGEHEPEDREGDERASDEREPDEQDGGGGDEGDGEAGDAGQGDGGGDSGGSHVEDISDTPAPSIGPGSKVEREPVEVRLARHEQSDVDAMGQDKRRQVVGKTYGPTLARQAALYGIFLVVIVAIGFGIKVAVDHFDQPPDHFAAQAPWAQKGVKQIKPKPLQ